MPQKQTLHENAGHFCRISNLDEYNERRVQTTRENGKQNKK